MKLKQYIGFFFMLLILGAALQPLDQLMVDTDIELSDMMDKEAKDGMEKDLKTDLFIVRYLDHSCEMNPDIIKLNFSENLNLVQGFDDIILPPPEC